MPEQIANLSVSTLSSGISPSDTTIVLADGSKFPSSGMFRITIDPDGSTPEIAFIQSRSTNTLTAFIRGDGSTTARTWNAGTKVVLSLTKESVDAKIQETAISRDRSMRNLWKKFAAAQAASGTPYPHVKWMTAGDSMSQDMSLWYLPVLQRISGQIAGAYFPGNYFGTTVNATTGTVTGNTTDFDAWYSGNTDQYATAATRTYGMGGSTFVCNQIKVFYVKGPASSKDGGDFKIQIDGVDQGGFLSVSTLNAGGITLGIATLTPALAAHNVTVVCNNAPIRIIGVGFENTTIRGLVPINGSQGGIALNSPTTAAWANYSLFLANVLPDVITYEAKEDSSYFPAALTSFFNAINAGTTSADVVMIGSSPVGPTAYSSKGDSEQILQNAQLRQSVSTQGYPYYYWDGYTPLGGWSVVNSLGWGTDQVHLTTDAHKYRAKQFLQDLGINFFIGQSSGLDVNASLIGVDKELDLGKNASDRMAKIIADATFDNDLSVQVRRYLKFLKLDGSVEYARLDLSGTGTGTSFMKFLRFGATNFAGIGGADADTVFVGKNDTASQPGDIYLRRVRTVNQAATTSGAITMDLAVAAIAVYTLNGNVTSFAFSNPTGNELIEVHFVQDGTGSRTLAGVNASIKFAGAVSPTLTTTINRRDIFTFRNIGGTYYELSRSMNVG